MNADSLKLLILGAHPDDAEFHAGGLAANYRALGHQVKMVSVTDGGAGHHRHTSEELVRVRRQEAAAAGRVIGAEYVTWDFPDGRLEPTLEVRERIIRELRSYAPDLVLTHRTCDYHPDHRAVGQAVQDASYMVTVPLVTPDVPILRRDPVVAYMVDCFTKPCRFEPHVIIEIASRLEQIVDMLACHRSQVFEFLPFNLGVSEQVPEGDEERRVWLKHWYTDFVKPRAEFFQASMVRQFGSQRAAEMQFIEAYEVSEYAAQPDEQRLRALFPAGLR